jgi:hypothetical protein
MVGIIGGAVVGLQSWILRELVCVKVKLAALAVVLHRLPCEAKRRVACVEDETEP